MSIPVRGAGRDPKLPDLLSLAGTLKLTVVSAKNLPLREGSAPFIKVLVGRHQVGTTDARMLSDTSLLSPGEAQWNETFEFELNADVREVRIVLMDWSLPFSSNPVGTLRMSPGEFVTGSMAGILREKQILLQKGEGEDAAVVGGNETWFPSDRKPTLLKLTCVYEPDQALVHKNNPQLSPLLKPMPANSPMLKPTEGGGAALPLHASHSLQQHPPLSSMLLAQQQPDASSNRHRTKSGAGIIGATIECPVAKGPVYVPHRQALTKGWYTRRIKERKRKAQRDDDDDIYGEGAGVMKALQAPPSEIFAFPALFLEAPEFLRELLLRLLADWALAERWNDLRSFPQGDTGVIRQGVGLNDLIPLHTEGRGDRLSEACCLAVWGAQDRSRDLDAAMLYEVDKNKEWFYGLWKEQQGEWLREREIGAEGGKGNGHVVTDEQWEESWAKIMREFDGGGERRCSRATLSLKLLVLAHVMKRVIVVMHDEDYSKEIVGAKNIAREDPDARPQSSDAVWILGKPGRVLESFRQNELERQQLGTLSSVNLQGVYVPYMYPSEKRRRSPLSLMFCSISGGFLPLVAQEGQYTDLHFKLPWPPLVALSSRGGDTFLPIPYGCKFMPPSSVFDDPVGGETYTVLPEEVLLREWVTCEALDDTTKRIMSASASTNLRRARRVRAVYAVLKDAGTSPDFWAVMRRFVVLADHHRRSALGQAGEDLTGIDITDHMVESKPFPDGYRATGKAGELEYHAMVQALSKHGRLPKFLQKNGGSRGRSRGGGEVEEDEFQRRRSAWMIGRVESHEREERAELEAQHHYCQLAGMGVQGKDLDPIVDAVKQHIKPRIEASE